MNKKNCSTCSFYVTIDSIEHLNKDEQIEFEKINVHSLSSIDTSDLQKLGFLLSKLRKTTCIGGLLSSDKIKERCNYYKSLSINYDNLNDLKLIFNEEKENRYKKNNIILTMVFGLLTLVLTFYGIQINKEGSKLKTEIKDKNDSIKIIKTNNKVLNDSIYKLNKLLTSKKAKHEQK